MMPNGCWRYMRGMSSILRSLLNMTYQRLMRSGDGYPILCRNILISASIRTMPLWGAYAGPFVGRAAYGWSAEVTVYLDHRARKQGFGRKLYEALEGFLREMGILNLYACIASPREEDRYLTRDSMAFHQHLGFRKVGEFHHCGYKFDRWYDMVWMEKIIGKHTVHPDSVKRYLG